MSIIYLLHLYHNSARVSGLAWYAGAGAQEHHPGVLRGVAPRVALAVHDLPELLQARHEAVRVHRLADVLLYVELRLCGSI